MNTKAEIDFLLRDEDQIEQNEHWMTPKYTIKELGVDTVYFSVFSLIVSSLSMRTKIDQLFNVSKGKYAIEAEKHRYYDLFTKSSCSFKYIDSAIKLLGLYAVEGDKVLLNLLKQGWKREFSAFERLCRKGDTGFFETTEDEIRLSLKNYSVDIIGMYYLYVCHKSNYWYVPINFNDPMKKPILAPLVCQKEKRNLVLNAEIFEVANVLEEELGVNRSEFADVSKYFDVLIYKVNYRKLSDFVYESGLNATFIDNSRIDNDTIKTIVGIINLHLWKKDIYDIKDVDSKAILYDFATGIVIAAIVQEYNLLKEKYFEIKQEKNYQKLFQKVKEAEKASKAVKKEFSNKDKRIAELEAELEKERAKNRKLSQDHTKEIAEAVKFEKSIFDQKEKEMADQILLLKSMIEDLSEKKHDDSISEDVTFDEMINLIKETENILYCCSKLNGTGIAKVSKLQERFGNMKFFCKENEPLPANIDYIFCDYNLMNHGMFYKIRELVKRRSIPMYYIQSTGSDRAIKEMYFAIMDK